MMYTTTQWKPPVFSPDAVLRTLEERQATDSIAAALVKAGMQAVVLPVATKGVETYQVGISADDWAEAERAVGKM